MHLSNLKKFLEHKIKKLQNMIIQRCLIYVQIQSTVKLNYSTPVPRVQHTSNISILHVSLHTSQSTAFIHSVTPKSPKIHPTNFTFTTRTQTSYHYQLLYKQDGRKESCNLILFSFSCYPKCELFKSLSHDHFVTAANKHSGFMKQYICCTVNVIICTAQGT